MVARESDRTDSSAGNGKSFKYFETLGDSVVRGGVNNQSGHPEKGRRHGKSG